MPNAPESMESEQHEKPFDPNEALQRLEQAGADKDLVAILKHVLDWQDQYIRDLTADRAARGHLFGP